MVRLAQSWDGVSFANLSKNHTLPYLSIPGARKVNCMVAFNPIGVVHTAARTVPRHWSLSEVEGTLEVSPQFQQGLSHIRPGQRIVVLFHFHKSPPFHPGQLCQKPPHAEAAMGVFSICSPFRPNPIGLSVVEVLAVAENRIRVKGIDMLDGTPVLDIKPYVTGKWDCPSYNGESFGPAGGR